MNAQKKLLTACVALSASMATAMLSASHTRNHLVNAYGEPAGFGNMPEVFVPDHQHPGSIASGPSAGNSGPGTAGLYVLPGAANRRAFESIGAWQIRTVPEGRVEVGPLLTIDSGPTGPMTDEALEYSREELTTQVLTGIKATDRVMRSLRVQAKSLSSDAQEQLKLTAREVSERRDALRESLRLARAADGNTWSSSRAMVATNYNAYTQSLQRAQQIVAANLGT